MIPCTAQPNEAPDFGGSAAPPPGDGAPISSILIDLGRSWRDDRITLGGLLDRLGDRGFGLLLLILALPNLIPIPIPVASILTGPPMVVLAILMCLGRPRPWLPGALRRRSIAREDFLMMAERAEKPLRRVEKHVRPRPGLFTRKTNERLMGLVCVPLAICVCAPLPLTNWLPALMIALMAMALVEHDGDALNLGMLGGAISAIVTVAVIIAFGALTATALSELFSLFGDGA